MVKLAQEHHTDSRIISRNRIKELLQAKVNTESPLFGIIVYSYAFTNEKILISRDSTRESLLSHLDHERMTICSCTGNCLYEHGDNCENPVIYERFVISYTCTNTNNL